MNPLHADEQSAAVPCVSGPLFYKGIKGLAAAQVEVTHAKVGAIRKGKGFLEDREEFILDVVENPRHLGYPPLRSMG
jgi:hypothetical protein